jgi:hypothetical protein
MCISWCLLNISHLKMHGKCNVKYNFIYLFIYLYCCVWTGYIVFLIIQNTMEMNYL